MEFFSDLSTFLEANPALTIAIVFIVSMAEAVLILGIFVPCTAVLIGAGSLVGLGKLDFWPIFVAASIGAMVGDAISFWLGRHYGQRLKTFWPLTSYPGVVANGEQFFHKHGVKGIAIGRFIPAIKAIIPGIAGMMGMSPIRFTVVNFLSAFVWAAAHLIPGMMLGQGLTIAHHISPLLLELIVGFLVVMALAAWAVKVAFAWLSAAGHSWSEGATGSERRWVRWLGWGVATGITNFVPLVLTIVAAATLVLTSNAVVNGQAGFAADPIVAQVLQSIRSDPGDHLMVAATMLTDEAILLVMALAMVGILFAIGWRREAVIVLAACCVLFVSVHIAKVVFHRPRPDELSLGAGAFGYPSGHVAYAAALLGMLGVLVARAGQGWLQSSFVVFAAILITLTAYSRLYLNVNWLSDVAAGLAVGVILTVAVAVLIPRRETGSSPNPLILAVVVPIVLILAGLVNVLTSYGSAFERYAHSRSLRPLTMSQQKWAAGDYQILPAARSTIDHHRTESFVAQVAGAPPALSILLAEAGWQEWVPAWLDLASYLSVEKTSSELPPLPLLHQGRLPKMAWTKPDPADPNVRHVVRAWTSPVMLKDDGAQTSKELLLLTLATERLERPFGVVTIVEEHPLELDDARALLGPTFSARSQLVEKAGRTAEAEIKRILLVSLD